MAITEPDDDVIAQQQQWLLRLDLLGATASALCAAHCALLPLLVAALPFSGLEAFESHVFDRGFVIGATLLAVLVIGSGCCRHRLRWVIAIFALAEVLLVAGAFFTHERIAHALLLALGGALLASAHLINRHGLKHHRCRAVNLFRPP
jgi:hypothetical protein